MSTTSLRRRLDRLQAGMPPEMDPAEFEKLSPAAQMLHAIQFHGLEWLVKAIHEIAEEKRSENDKAK